MTEAGRHRQLEPSPKEYRLDAIQVRNFVLRCFLRSVARLADIPIKFRRGCWARAPAAHWCLCRQHRAWTPAAGYARQPAHDICYFLAAVVVHEHGSSAGTAQQLKPTVQDWRICTASSCLSQRCQSIHAIVQPGWPGVSAIALVFAVPAAPYESGSIRCFLVQWLTSTQFCIRSGRLDYSIEYNGCSAACYSYFEL